MLFPLHFNLIFSMISDDKLNTVCSELILKEKILDTILQQANRSHFLKNLKALEPVKECCKNVLDTLKPVDSVKVAIGTQNDINLWHKERQFRITGSRCYSLYTYSKDDWSNKTKKYFWPKKFTNRL